MGLKPLVEILQSYLENAELLCGGLAEACAEEKWDDASRLAQDIAGAAGGLGLIAVTAAARGFTQKTRRAKTVTNCAMPRRRWWANSCAPGRRW